MASLTIRDLDDRTKERLRVRAAKRRHSMEAEARHILRTTLAQDDVQVTNLAAAIHERFRALGGLDLTLPDREPMRPPPRPTLRRR